MSDFHIGSISSGHDTNIDSSLGESSNTCNTSSIVNHNITKINNNIESIKRGIDDANLQHLLDDLKIAITNKDDTGIGDVLNKITSLPTMAKLAFNAIKALF